MLEHQPTTSASEIVSLCPRHALSMLLRLPGLPCGRPGPAACHPGFSPNILFASRRRLILSSETLRPILAPVITAIAVSDFVARQIWASPSRLLQTEFSRIIAVSMESISCFDEIAFCGVFSLPMTIPSRPANNRLWHFVDDKIKRANAVAGVNLRQASTLSKHGRNKGGTRVGFSQTKPVSWALQHRKNLAVHRYDKIDAENLQ